MGVFEMASFEGGTKAMMDKIVEVTTTGTVTVIGAQFFISSPGKRAAEL